MCTIGAHAPFLIGCFGPVASLNACKALYPGCSVSTNVVSFATTKGTYSNYIKNCPCYQQGGVSINQVTPGTTSTSSAGVTTTSSTNSTRSDGKVDRPVMAGMIALVVGKNKTLLKTKP